MTTRHKIIAVRTGCTNGMDWEAEYTIWFSYDVGATGPEIVLIAIEPISDYGPAAAEELDWCNDWLDENADKAIDAAQIDLLNEAHIK